MKGWIKTIVILCCGLLFQLQLKAQLPIDEILSKATIQYKEMLNHYTNYTRFPQSANVDGTLRDMPSSWWCSGFFPGSLWYLYELTNDSFWLKKADNWTMSLSNEQYNSSDHDLGFKLFCSFGNGFRLTNDSVYKNVLLNGAKALSERFNPKVGLIKSWDKFQKIYKYPVIIDNMMNLELLMWASNATNNPTFYNIACKHADNTLKYHFRNDHSSFHVVCYDEKGKVLAKKTHQGANDSSAWARGQAWGLYGFTVMYRETKQKKYLKQAKAIADFMLNNPHLPKDNIPYWDFNAPNIPSEPRDASAAAIEASALLELSAYLGNNGAYYFKKAESILTSLSQVPYLAEVGTNANFLLTQSVGSFPHNSDINVPIVYADYYFLEALIRYKNLMAKNKIN